MVRRLLISLLASAAAAAPLAVNAQAPLSSTTLLNLGAIQLTLVDVLPVIIAAAGIGGLVLIRKHTQFL